MSKTFSLAEANALIPTVTRLVTELQRLYKVLLEKQRQFAELERHVKLMGGVVQPQVGDLGSDIEGTMQEMGERIRDISALGCELKDIPMGLVDFPSIRENREVYLCWKLGEPEIRHWHELSTGFAGRQPL